MSNHWHGLVTDPHGRIPEFCRDVHSLAARALNAHLGRSEPLWCAQRLILVDLFDGPGVSAKLVFLASYPVEAAMVSLSVVLPLLSITPLHVPLPPSPFLILTRISSNHRYS